MQEILEKEILPSVLKLCRRRSSVETTTKTGLVAAGISFLVFLFQGMGVFPAGTGLIVLPAAVGVVVFSALFAFLRIKKPEDSLKILGRKDALADAVRSALGLVQVAENRTHSEEMVRAHLAQTRRMLAQTSTREVFGVHNLQRLQVMAVLFVCIVSAALL